jgi:long-subunit fatty acid transport protein
MKLGGLTLTMVSCISATATAGGLLLPGSGAVSSSRAGASVAATDDAESIGLNPAGIAKTKGTKITIGAATINYFMTFQRNGSYDDNPNDAESFEGQRYPIVTQDAEPPLGIGRYQPVPVIGIVSDLGGKVENLTVGFGIYAPNAYPHRRMNNVNGQNYFVPNDKGGYEFPAFGAPPPPTRYDIVAQEAAVILPSVVAAYRVLPDLDVGVRFSAGIAEVKSTLTIWGTPANYAEWIKGDGLFTLDAKDSLVLGGSLGAAYRIGKNIELGLNITPQTNITAKGNAHAVNGPNVSLNGEPFMVSPSGATRCQSGGTAEFQKGCVQFALPMTATVGGRYKIVDENDKPKADVELDVTWEHWGKRCDYVADPGCHSPNNYRVVVDAQVATVSSPDNGIDLKDNVVDHGLQDTFGIRLGGSYHIAAGANEVIARGGLAYDTAAAKAGWERADFDGAARTTLTAGASYKMSRVQIDAGFGAILEGTRDDSRNCNPALKAPPYEGCGPNMEVQPLDDRLGPDPINPIQNPDTQLENPVNQGTYKSHYLMFMLGVSTWF